MTDGVRIEQGFDAGRREAVLAILREYGEYAASPELFAGYEAELASLPGVYAPPTGAMYLALEGRGEAPLGIALLRTLAPGIAEMKRLYVRPAGRGTGAGRLLIAACLAEARRLDCREVRLDTLPHMQAAQALYRALGFREIANYNGNPVAGVRFFGFEL
jgi:ribosomal protein S18 acetylase RimI-like enzyme